MANPIAQFYDNLAPDYHFIFPDWKQSARRQGEILNRFICVRMGDASYHIWDCTCGIGTQTFGLALHGHHVHGTDLSSGAIARAHEYATAFDMPLAPTFAVADLLNPPAETTEYDIVLSCDNAVAHFLDDADLSKVIDTMIGQLRPDGLLLISLRDYDRIVQEAPRTTLPSISEAGGKRTIIFQVWDWTENNRGYHMQMFVTRPAGDGWQTDCHTTHLRALQRPELTAILKAKSLYDIQWHLPETSGYYQPIVTARKGA